MIVMVILPLCGVINVSEALAGFSDPNVILIAAMSVIGEGLVRTGIAYRLGDWLVHKAGGSENRLLALPMLATAGLGSVMSSTGVVAIFIPVALGIAERMRVPPNRLMMPLSFASPYPFALIVALASSAAFMTRISSPVNMLVLGPGQYRFVDFVKVGVPFTLLVILISVLLVPWLFPLH